MMYIVKSVKIGCKSFGIRKRISIDSNGIAHKFCGGDGCVTGIQLALDCVREMQNSNAHSRIAVYEWTAENETKIFDWSMCGAEQEKQKKSHAEYTAKRNALKAEIERLKAELKELDNDWYSVK